MSPLYVSVHATDPDARIAMLRNPDGARLKEHLERLFAGGIQIHGQIVYTPGLNDGTILDRTIQDMAAYHCTGRDGGCLTMAIVPVGLTTQRSNLPKLRTLAAAEAQEVLQKCRGWQRRFRAELGTRFVFPSDEMYLIAGKSLPGSASYEDFPQYENGIGMIPRLRDQWRKVLRKLPERVRSPRRVTVATGELAAPVLAPMAERLSQVGNMSVRVAAIRNDFFGPTVTVAGLMTGQDLAAQLADQDLGDALLLPAVATRDEWFMDDWTLSRLSETLGVPVHVVPTTAAALAEAALGEDW